MVKEWLEGLLSFSNGMCYHFKAPKRKDKTKRRDPCLTPFADQDVWFDGGVFFIFFCKGKKNACGTTKQFWTQIIQNIKIHEFSSGTFKKKENYPNLVSGCFQSPRSSNPLALLTPSLRCNSNRLSTPWFMQLFKGGGWSWWLEVLDTWLQWIQKPGIFGTGNLKRKKVQNHLRLKSVGWEKNMWSFLVG